MQIQGTLQRIRDVGTDIRIVYTMREDGEGRIVFVVEESFYTDRWGTWRSGYASFYGPDGRREGVLGMDIEAAEVIARERQFLWVALAVLAVTASVASLVGWLLGGRVTVESREGEGSTFTLWLRAAA